ncbi:MAG: hypothetical protein HY056_14625 [Proteobacteria bacterium]|nr:hypothetical protein [Pseudomonadota bacterium]
MAFLLENLLKTINFAGPPVDSPPWYGEINAFSAHFAVDDFTRPGMANANSPA